MTKRMTDEIADVAQPAEIPAESTDRSTHVAEVADRTEGRPPEQPVSRRGFVSRSTLATLATASAPLWLPKTTAQASVGGVLHTLILVFLRGGADALSMIAPRSSPTAPDAFYVAQRQTPNGPQLAIPMPAAGNGVIGLSDPVSGVRLPWMLSAGAAPAHPMFQARDLAFVQGVGFPVVNNGSHFFSQDFMEDGTQQPGTVSDGNGWAGRAMLPVVPGLTWRGMGYSKILQRTLFGAPSTLAIPDPENFDLVGTQALNDKRKLALDFLYKYSDEPMKSSGANALATLAQINHPAIFTKPSTATYPANSHFADQLKNVQKLIQASHDPSIPVALETVMIDYGDWDNHNQMGPTPDTPANPSSEGMHKRMLDLFGSLQGFWNDMKSHASTASYTVVVMTEFGRRITANADAGVDHGNGSLMVVMGSAGVNGGKVFTMLPNVDPLKLDGGTPGWNGLQNHAVLQGGTPGSWNLKATIDYRRVVGEILQKRLLKPVNEVQGCFPGYAYGSSAETNPVGVIV